MKKTAPLHPSEDTEGQVKMEGPKVLRALADRMALLRSKTVPAAVSKPPYRVPMMDEVRAIPWNDRVIASTFSGCGGSCLGFRMAGFRVGWANEFVRAARATYRKNCDRLTYLDGRDIRDVKAEDILAVLKIGVGDLDVFEGSPPCVDFSTAGKRAKGWGKVRHHADGSTGRADDLFLVWTELVRQLQPKVFLAENVSGLIKGVAKGYFQIIIKAMREAGYMVESRLLDAQYLGVPQMRQRVFFMGVRNDLVRDYGARPAWPEPLPYLYTVRDALPWLSAGQRAFEDTGGQFSGGEMTDRPSFTIRASGVGHLKVEDREPEMIVGNEGFKPKFGPLDSPSPTVMAGGLGKTQGYFRFRRREDIGGARRLVIAPDGMDAVNKGRCLVEGSMEGTAVGREWERLRPGGQSKRYFQLVRADPDQPCGTVTALGGNVEMASVSHPSECRKFTIAALRRLGAFPDDFALTGTYAEQWARVGNSVPPLMMRAIAVVIRDVVLRNVPLGRLPVHEAGNGPVDASSTPDPVSGGPLVQGHSEGRSGSHRRQKP